MNFKLRQLLFISNFVVIDKRRQGCCGQEQIVLCNATAASSIDITVDDLDPVQLTLINENESSLVDGFLISLLDVIPDPDFMVLSQFFVEVKFTAIANSVTITCETSTDIATLDVITNSKFMHI